MNEKEDKKRATVVFYKARITDKDGSKRFWIFKTAKPGIEEIFKNPALTIPGVEKEYTLARLNEHSVESVELLYEGPAFNIITPFNYLMTDIYQLGTLAASFKENIQSLSAITSDSMMSLELLAKLMKAKVNELRCLMSCLLEWDTEVTEEHPLLIEDELSEI